MKFQRGDVVIVYFPFSSGTGAKVRPALVVQNDINNRRLSNLIVATITTMTRRSDEPTQFLVDLASPIGQLSGLAHDSVVTCENLATLNESLVRAKIGTFPPSAMSSVDECLKASLGIP
ncbi:MAG: transcriptional modulator of MazE/toxin, MazF [Planctomycetaceae bacterium]|nr:transcriptional modulator of MazE/toxin, MazF [Planctomycetaceae bacterium]